MTPPEPTIEPPAAQNTPTPPTRPAPTVNTPQPPARPKTVGSSPFTMEQIIADGRRRVIEENRDPKEIAAAGSKAFGVELSPDLFTPPPPPAAPQPGVDPTAIESGNVPAPGGNAPSSPMDFLRSLFGS
jgi:hypothetical protein